MLQKLSNETSLTFEGFHFGGSGRLFAKFAISVVDHNGTQISDDTRITVDYLSKWT